MKLRSKEPYWLLKNGLIGTYPSLQKDITCDILVVGGGITGALIAYQFSKEGYRTVLIDRRDISLGSTSASTSLLQYELDEPLYALIKKVGANAAIDTYLEGVRSIEKLGSIIKSLKADCGFERKQSVYMAHSKKDAEWLLTEFEARQRIGLKVTWLTKERLKRKFDATGEGAILSETGAATDVYQLVRCLIEYSIKNYRLRVFDHTELVKVENLKDSCEAKVSGGSIIKARKIVYATGYESQAMLRDKVVDLISTFTFISEPLKIPSHLRHTLFWDTEDPYLYMRATDDNRILVGGEDEQFKNPERRDRLIDKKQELLLKKATTKFSGLKLIPDYAWAGTFGVTKDALPYIGEHPDYPNAYFVLAFGGNGITFSVMGMQILSDALAGRPNKFLEYFRFRR
ncbi:MAG TPA: FAD-binding oxidoreductase [Cyclobacteriaceae bacterium]|nr:FAD-binding oxidoreductase [Cyclobacteriaceae bacterium]HMV10696.1 FAD-binding oxidoreductase [Cyclobacteriaceae bacterium]HMV91543.1 FAD-binding oxidoreductase [Cyclobacteriaceae bacterium]HMX00065.1 FAD-binding oxidoreductase [Cyclobacteriaceae bacterium]HMX49073.1 FAD-binding oxidoreductase [Cyclobacteriaceae bacterium]